MGSAAVRMTRKGSIHTLLVLLFCLVPRTPARNLHHTKLSIGNVELLTVLDGRCGPKCLWLRALPSVDNGVRLQRPHPSQLGAVPEVCLPQVQQPLPAGVVPSTHQPSSHHYVTSDSFYHQTNSSYWHLIPNNENIPRTRRCIKLGA